mmetsp:Transcript_93873/g.166070  ORF Transcript_93873/g.166070 Transcript_93873/m.166070 type:complete len:295 (+) Transcript_93873:122-1006(+)
MWFIVDACGLVCMMITYGLLSGSNLAVVKFGWWAFFKEPLIPVLKLLYELWFIFAIWSHLACMLTDPGAVPLNVEASEGERQCSKCKTVKPPKAHHCSICNRCIMKMDHHCPWVNNCVGARNQKHFVLFLVYVQLQCYAAVFLLGAQFMHSTTPHRPRHRHKAFLAKSQPYITEEDRLIYAESENWAHSKAAQEARMEHAKDPFQQQLEDDGKIVACILVFFVAIVFGLFTTIMLCDQVSNIVSGQTGIDQLKKESETKTRPWRESMQEVMGRGPSWRWLVPIPLRRGQVKDET